MYSRAFIILYLATACAFAFLIPWIGIYSNRLFSPHPPQIPLEGTDYIFSEFLEPAFIAALFFPLIALPQILLGAYVLTHWARKSTYSIWKCMLLGTIMLGSFGIIISGFAYIFDPVSHFEHHHYKYRMLFYRVFWSFSFAGLLVGWISWHYKAFYTKPVSKISEKVKSN